MATVPLSWKLSIQGAEEVKSKLNELDSAFASGKISTMEYAKGKNELNRVSKQLITTGNTEKNLYLAMHPRLNQLTRSMSSLASVSRTLLSITSAINLARIAGQGPASEEVELNSKIAETMRAMNRETDPEKKQALNEQLAIFKARLKELGSEDILNKINGVGVAFGSIALGVHQTIKSIPSLIKMAKQLSPLLQPLTKFLSNFRIPPLVGPLAGGLTGITAGALIFPTIDEWLKSWNEGYRKWAEFRDTVMKPALDEFFLKTIPDSIKTGLWGAWKAAVKISITAINAIGSGVTFLINVIREGINVLISAYNSFAKLTGRPTVKLLPKLTFTPLEVPDFGEKIVGNNVTKNGIPGTLVYNYVTVQGSVIRERELVGIVDKNMKGNLKNKGFTGF